MAVTESKQLCACIEPSSFVALCDCIKMCIVVSADGLDTGALCNSAQ